jgi:hypothetical protein
MKVKLSDFAEAISTRIWDSVGRANWRSFNDARAFARTLDLKSVNEWREYCKSGKKPPDIPAKPNRTYASDGWANWGDWLGTGRIADGLRKYRPFKKGRVLARSLQLNSATKWFLYCKSGKKPNDIPYTPHVVYRNDGWAGWGDWLGTGRVREFRSFKKARVFTRGLGLTSGKAWRGYARSGSKPADIPANPDQSYAHSGWAGWGDWLGTGTVAAQQRQYRPFKKARAFVSRLALKSGDEWRSYCKSGKKPSDIPASPERVYAEKGWAGWGDWLGTGRVRRIVTRRVRGKSRSFKKARAFVLSRNLKTRAEWSVFCKSGKKPNDIPASPEPVYAEKGWAGWGDWLGTGTVATHLRRYRPFKKARAFVRSRNLKTRAEWSVFCKSGKKPSDLPSDPAQTYKENGWTGWGDWLGTRTVATHLRRYRPFKKARAFVRSRSLKSVTEWQEFCKSGKKPNDIPVAPEQVYAKNGWAGWGDWLGTGTVATHLRQYRPFKKARAFVRSRSLKSVTEWKEFCKSGKKPDDIPNVPWKVYAENGWAGFGDWLGNDQRRGNWRGSLKREAEEDWGR